MTGEELQKQFGSKYIRESEKLLERIAFERIARDQSQLIAKYEEYYGNDISTDKALKFFVEDGYEGTNSNIFHKPAVIINNAVFEHYLLSKKDNGRTVIFTAGGTGAGKTSSLKSLDKSGSAFSYDSNLAVFDKSVAKIDAVLNAGYEVFIAFVHRPAINAFAEGVITRTLSLLKSGQQPRTVPISAHVKTHTDCLTVALQIHEKYKKNGKFHLQVFDNSFAEGKAILVPLSFLETQLYTELAKESLTQRLHEIADEKFKDGTISEKIYKSFIVKPPRSSK